MQIDLPMEELEETKNIFRFINIASSLSPIEHELSNISN